uniref:Glucagon / GIP / secretin / VIP family domain-containing protein n=1 Tax=Takifugu rubripes TaxID=31033 RepID=A0A674MVD2_TAKRU
CCRYCYFIFLFFLSAFPRWCLHQVGKGGNTFHVLKRHSEGTFSHDFSRYLDKIKTKAFVEWLASTKER